ncbi:MAG: hypothetical protein JXB49_01110 [Bacteroidales bacterium]|nr:hypothetical protein [Bacteroidales bacterium]
MKRYSILFLFIIFIPCIYSQEIFKEGYVITNKQDTLYGQIKYMGPARNSLECHFIPKGSLNAIVYTPEDIFGYRFTNGNYYVSKTFTIDKVENMQFAEFLVDGIADLYKIYYNGNQEYFLIKNDTTSVFINAIASSFITENEMRERDKCDLLNKGSLKYVMQDYPSIYSRIDQLHYDDRSLINIVKDYHSGVCNSYECIDYTKRNFRPDMHVGIYCGIKSSRMKFYGDDYFYFLIDAVEETKMSMLYGLSLGMNMPSTNERLSIDINLSRFSEKYQIDYNGGLDINRIEEIQNETTRSDPEISTIIISFDVYSTGIDVNYLLVDRKIKMKPLIGAGFFSLRNAEYKLYRNNINYDALNGADFTFNTYIKTTLNTGFILEYDITDNLGIQLKNEVTYLLSDIESYKKLYERYFNINETVRLVRYF